MEKQRPKLCFDVISHPTHVTFDDGKRRRRNYPWLHYQWADWEFDDPRRIVVSIGDEFVIIRGYNLAALFQAIEEHKLTRVRVNAKSINDPSLDTYATEIRFMPKAPPKKGQAELDLGLG
jgi:hypothetical protein